MIVLAQAVAVITSACGPIITTGWRTYCSVTDIEQCCVAWNSTVATAICALHYEAQTPVAVGDCQHYLSGGVLAGSHFRKLNDSGEWLLEFRPPKQMIGLTIYAQMIAPQASSSLMQIPVLARAPTYEK